MAKSKYEGLLGGPFLWYLILKRPSYVQNYTIFIMCYLFNFPLYASEFCDEDHNQLEETLSVLFGKKVSVQVDEKQNTVRFLGTEE